MPKLFTITVGIEEIAVGRVMRMLHNTPGVARVDIAMGSPKLNGVTGRDIITDLLKKGPVTFRDAANAFEAAGKSPKGVGSCLDLMKKGKQIVRKGKVYLLRSVS